MEQDIYLYPGSQSEAHRLGEAALWDASFHANVSVSYTHLTLPTKA